MHRTSSSDGYTCKFCHNFEEQNFSILQNKLDHEKRKKKRKGTTTSQEIWEINV